MTIHQEFILASDYTDVYDGGYFDCYQIHVLSYNKVFSTYFDRELTDFKQLKLNAENVVNEITNRTHTHSNSPAHPTLFEKNGKFLITYNNDILDPVELFEFDPEFVRYEAAECDDLFEFIGDVPIDVFLKSAMVSIGAEELYSEIAEQVNKLVELQNSDIAYHAEIRALDKSDPKFLVEVYKIEKDYKPVLVEELQSHHFEKTVFLPEHRYIMKSDSRFAFKAIDIDTKKVVEDNIADTVELIRYTKHLRKNPPTIDLGDLQRMELDNDDPDFLSWEEYTANDDEHEEGDDDYVPRP